VTYGIWRYAGMSFTGLDITGNRIMLEACLREQSFHFAGAMRDSAP
jgi:hypothetical protein